MCEFLDDSRPVFYFRRAVPDDLIGHFLTSTGKPRTEWRFSLRTKDRSAAKAAVHRLALETQEEIDGAHPIISDPAMARSLPPMPSATGWAGSA